MKRKQPRQLKSKHNLWLYYNYDYNNKTNYLKCLPISNRLHSYIFYFLINSLSAIKAEQQLQTPSGTNNINIYIS